MKTKLLFACLLMSFVGFAQDFSNKGKEFWIPYSYHVAMVNGNINNLSMTLYITSDYSTNFKVEVYGGATIQTGAITAGQVTPVTIPNTYVLNNGGKITGKTVRVTSDKPVVVYSYISFAAVSGATVCLPTNVLGREYISTNYTQTSNEGRSNSYFTIVAVEDNTEVEITPTATTTNGWAAGSVNTISLNKGEIYQVLGTVNATGSGGNWLGADLTGTTIRSISTGTTGCKKIAVFSGAGKVKIGNNCPTNATSSDNLYQQLYPKSSWGKNYLTVPSFSRPNNFYRIIKSISSANVYLNGNLIPSTSFVNDTYYEFASNTPNSITSDHPISVAQYFTTERCSQNTGPYDPDMILLNPVEQNISEVTLVSSNLIATAGRQHHLHVIMPNRGTGISSFKIDGAAIPAASWVQHPGNLNYSYAYISNVAEGYHTLSSDSGFNALAYGYANAESYGYSAGANIKDLYQYVSIRNSQSTVDFPATCVNTPFRFSMTFPYQPVSIKWQFGTALNALGIADVNLTGPLTPDSVFVKDGKTLYTYRLPTYYKIPAKGSYDVLLTAETPPAANSCGSSFQDIDFTLEVTDRPVANFTTSDVCLNSPSLFADNSNTDGRPIQPALSKWVFSPTVTQSGASTSYTFNSPGTKNIEYTIVTDIGCVSDPYTGTHTVKPLPTATITGTISVCLNEPTLPQITFQGADGAPNFTFTYSLNGVPQTPVVTAGSNTTSILAPTNVTGPFNYVLTKIKEGSTNGCEQSYPIAGVTTPSAIVTVLPTPSANIGVDKPTVCLNEPVKPKITFTGINGDAPYTFTYRINGGAVLTTPAGTGNSVSIDHDPSLAGTFTYELLTVTDVNGSLCTRNVTGNAVITVLELPTATISGTIGVCKDAAQPEITFTGDKNSGPYTFSYNINGGPVQTIKTTTGKSITLPVATNNDNITYNFNLIRVESENPVVCSQPQTGIASVTIHPLPVADYSTTGPICATGDITFTDKSLAKSASLTNWEWDFGDPTSGTRNTSTTQSPVHAYLAAGTYPVSLVVTNSNGCKSVNTIPAVVVKPKPTADFILPEVCLKDTYAQFTDASKVNAPGSINAWNWNFGDVNMPNTSTQKDPKHSYSKVVRSYDVTLEVVTLDGCRDTIIQVLQINGDNPTPDFQVQTPTTLCANDLVSIKNLSFVGVGVVTKIEIIWDAANNPTVIETDEVPTLNKIYDHTYPNFQQPLTKTLDIILRAYSGQDCKQEIRKTITLNAAPKVAFQPISNICFDATPIQITQANETGNVPGTFKFFGNGVSSAGLFSPAVAGSGVHTLKYVYTSNTGGCADSITQTIKVWERAVADFNLTTTPVCEKKAMSFSDLSTSTEGSITERIWDFGYPSSGITRTVPNSFTHTLPGYGQYTISLTVKTSDGCSSAPVTKTYEALPIPRPNFTFPPVSCLPNASIQFTNASSVPNAAASTLTYSWDFGDPGSGPVNSSTQKDPQHTYANLGPFDVKLQATTAEGCLHDTTIVLNTIHPQPIASFTSDLTDVCLDSAIQFTNTSDPLDGTLKSIHWELGDGSTNNQQTFSHTYRTAGMYDVSLYIVNSYDCKSNIAVKPISANPNPVADAGPYRVVLEGGNITINANATNANGMTYLWTPPAGLNDPTLLRPIASPANDTRYLLRVTSDKGCVDTSSMFVKVLFKPLIPNTFTPNGDGINDKWDIRYLDSYPGAIVEVYNSVGTLIFRSVGYNFPWDGSYKGSRLPLGTYYYVVDPKNGRAKISGFVTIL